MRRLLPLLLGLFLAFGGSSPVHVSAEGADWLPDEDEVRTTLAPLGTVSGYQVLPTQAGDWDRSVDFQVVGGGDPPIKTHMYAFELPSEDAAAGNMQAAIQRFATSAQSNGLVLLPQGTDELQLDADEAYFAIIATPSGHPTPGVGVIRIARYETVVTSIYTSMESAGAPLGENAQRHVGAVLGALSSLVNDAASS